MPYSFESNHRRIPEHLDRRCKLTTIQKQEIVKKYETGSYSLNSLAKEYEVSKKLILLIVNTDSKAKNDKHIKDNWKKYQTFGEEKNKISTEHRHYKYELYKKGLLV